MDASGSSSSQV
jgi:hypothetical protein